MATDITKIWAYPQFDPSQDVVGMHGYVKGMNFLYGPNSDSADYNPMFSNIRNGALTLQPHYCTHNHARGHPLSRRCVTEGHQAYCLEWVSGGGRKFRCGTRFKLFSGGCSVHFANQMEKSSNLEIENLVAGKSHNINCGLLNDMTSIAEETEVAAAVAAEARKAGETIQAILDQHDEENEVLDSIGTLSVWKHTAYEVHVTFNDYKRMKDRKLREQRKKEAELRRSLTTMKGDNEAVNDNNWAISEPQHPKLAAGEQERRFGRFIFHSTKKEG